MEEPLMELPVEWSREPPKKIPEGSPQGIFSRTPYTLKKKNPKGTTQAILAVIIEETFLAIS